VNDTVGRIRQLFNWAVGLELIPPERAYALSRIRALPMGQGRETDRRTEVTADVVNATLPHLTDEARALVLFIRWTGCRPSEAARLRMTDIHDRDRPIWRYRPPMHKTAHRGQFRDVPIGPQARAILDHLDPWWHPLVLTMLGTGLRYGEVGALQWNDVRLEDAPAAIHVTRAWETPAGEGRGRILGTPKTKRSRRVVTLDSAGLVDVLRAHRDTTKGGPGDWVFAGPKGGPVGNNFRERTWRRAVEAALPDLHPRPTPHDCRHTHASWLIAAGVPLVVVQRRLGHESIQTTADRYGHLAPDTLALGAVAADAAVAEILAIARITTSLADITDGHPPNG
jgi:integrase